MSAPKSLLTRIRGEYREMPGLRLTVAQARRLWQLDSATCQTALDTLVAEGFLTRTGEGAFMAADGSGAARNRLAPLALRRGA
ncbi:MAG TPA: hypothetical protein VD833_19795 [Vicinamibacterales bacterium]|nr:hypothetical protein [Vicinamibacterales bacterium]